MPFAVRRSLVALLAAALLAPAAAGACGGAAADANEPNDEPGAATLLVPGEAVDGVLGDRDDAGEDADIFACEAPAGAAEDTGAAGEAEPHPFRVTVLTGATDDIDVQVGASIPGAMEGISWPGWDAIPADGRVTVDGALGGGTVLVVLTGEPGTAYSVGIDWE